MKSFFGLGNQFCDMRQLALLNGMFSF